MLTRTTTPARCTPRRASFRCCQSGCRPISPRSVPMKSACRWSPRCCSTPTARSHQARLTARWCSTAPSSRMTLWRRGLRAREICLHPRARWPAWTRSCVRKMRLRRSCAHFAASTAHLTSTLFKRKPFSRVIKWWRSTCRRTTVRGS